LKKKISPVRLLSLAAESTKKRGGEKKEEIGGKTSNIISPQHKKKGEKGGRK